MAFDRIFKSLSRSTRLAAVAPALLFGSLVLAAPAPAQAQSVGVGVQTCTVVLFVEVCTGGGASVGTGSASPAPAPMMGGSLLSLAALGGFIALRRRAALKAGPGADSQPAIED
jgi:hypothetical protein